VNRVSGRWFLVLLALVVVAFAIFYVRRTTIVLDAPALEELEVIGRRAGGGGIGAQRIEAVVLIRAEVLDVMPGQLEPIVNERHDPAHATCPGARNLMSDEDAHARRRVRRR